MKGSYMDDKDEIISGLTSVVNQLLEEVINLKKENSNLNQLVDTLNQNFSALLEMQHSLVNTISKNQSEVSALAETMTRSIDNVPYELDNTSLIPLPKLLTCQETVDFILHNKASIS